MPNELAKLESALARNAEETRVMEDLVQDLGSDLMDGIGDSLRALEFRSSISGEQSQIQQEIVRLQRERK